MKKTIILLSLWCFCFISLSAQHAGFLLEKFERGRVIYKSGGQVTDGNFNYDTVTEKMLFMLSDSTIFELARPDIVSEVNILDRTFEHIKNGLFYEKVSIDGNNLYIRWKSRAISEGKDAGYGTKSSTGAIDNVSQISVGGMMYHMRDTEEYKMISNNTFYIKVNNKFKRFDSFNSLAKLFKENQEAIKVFVKEQNLNFNNVDNIKEAVRYSFGLKAKK